MPGMVEVVKNQDKRGGHWVSSVLFGYAGSATGVTSLTDLAVLAVVLNFVHPFVQLYSFHSTNIYTRHRLLN